LRIPAGAIVSNTEAKEGLCGGAAAPKNKKSLLPQRLKGTKNHKVLLLNKSGDWPYKNFVRFQSENRKHL
jgi:hypothetical protein